MNYPNVYLFKTNYDPYEIKMRDKTTGREILVYFINPNCNKYKDGINTHGRRFNELFLIKEFETADWVWQYYMPALAAGGRSRLYTIIQELE